MFYWKKYWLSEILKPHLLLDHSFDTANEQKPSLIEFFLILQENKWGRIWTGFQNLAKQEETQAQDNKNNHHRNMLLDNSK